MKASKTLFLLSKINFVEHDLRIAKRILAGTCEKIVKSIIGTQGFFRKVHSRLGKIRFSDKKKRAGCEPQIKYSCRK